MNQDQIEKLIASIRAFSKCPTCQAQYEAGQIQLIEETANTCLLEMHCSKCNTKALGTVIIHDSDLSNSLPSKKFPYSLINKNKVIEFNQFLQKFDGNFVKLFSSLKKRNGNH